MFNRFANSWTRNCQWRNPTCQAKSNVYIIWWWQKRSRMWYLAARTDTTSLTAMRWNACVYSHIRQAYQCCYQNNGHNERTLNITRIATGMGSMEGLSRRWTKYGIAKQWVYCINNHVCLKVGQDMILSQPILQVWGPNSGTYSYLNRSHMKMDMMGLSNVRKERQMHVSSYQPIVLHVQIVYGCVTLA